MKGKVFLVGAGPGDYKLMTLKGVQCIKDADVIVYDRLANDVILKDAKENCEFIYVGKKSKYHTKTQDEINDIISEKALEGKIVTRLKGGDPYVFGRGGEEGEFLLEKGVDFEVVPGITSAIGGLCYAGIPITHRDFASSFHVITGHLKEEDKDLDWSTLAKLQGTLVFLMGVANLSNITSNLIAYGKSQDTPAAVINWGARPYQRVVTGTLKDIYDIVQRENIGSPSLIVIGGVVTLRDKLNFYEKKPLFGTDVIITRARAQSSKLFERINDLGGRPVEMPTIKIKEIENSGIENAIENLNKYTCMVFTSENAVDIFMKRLMDSGKDIRTLGNMKIAAIGKATALVLKKNGILADYVPDKFVAESLLELLKEKLTSKDYVLIPRAKEAREVLVDELSKICSVDEIKIYETIREDVDKDEVMEILKSNRDTYLTFTSSSTVKNFIEIVGEDNLSALNNTKIISIGPITSKTIESFGLKVYKEAEDYTIDGMIKTLIQDKNN
ncbi:uroporphyrinogen-III synthase [Hathewaya proteolytica DSM 3090]|uniref:uroporphyrinogen-III C-methyltransferase n=1 Tax=Hathewaya proteolytica DSM 3090 TaxID=1121331 RepID=A0A1M6RV04_9CLOT|nr:uroporphyrinogen-III C-methyltransferase [Hathewaya proteolytica]SHK36240.1 uroporphyrinogen-III synthase [Hathewaya proteolytica DSM 3090]